jgi:hypothetical protein
MTYFSKKLEIWRLKIYDLNLEHNLCKKQEYYKILKYEHQKFITYFSGNLKIWLSKIYDLKLEQNLCEKIKFY